jgi:integration host factor subunit beta
MKTITKKMLVRFISNKKGHHPVEVRDVVQAFLDEMKDALNQGDRLEFRDFGVFEVVQRKEKIGRNPKAPQTQIQIPKRRVVKFTPGKKMREQMNERG